MDNRVLDVTTIATQRAQMVAAVRAQLGVKWRHQGRLPFVALDCVGLLFVAFESINYQPRHPEQTWKYRNAANYPLIADDDELLQTMHGEADQIDLADVQIGDVVLFHWGDFDYPQHVGIISQVIEGVPYFIHAYRGTSIREVVENALTDEWLDALESTWRLKDWALGAAAQGESI